MIQEKGYHRCEFCFCFQKNGSSKYPAKTDKLMILNFKDVVYIMPEMILHYLDDKEVHGWTWKPKQSFIDRVMQGGEVSFEVESNEKRELIGFLKKYKDSSNNAQYPWLTRREYSIVDKSGEKVELGEVSEVFLNQMKFLHQKALEHERGGSSKITLLPASEFKQSIPAPDDKELAPKNISEIVYRGFGGSTRDGKK